jgi:hypothetical protein
MEKVEMLGQRKEVSLGVFTGCCESWEVRVERCTASGLNYFEEG